MRSSATTAGGCFGPQPLELGDLAGLDQADSPNKQALVR
jgi:hypothetical protein